MTNERSIPYAISVSKIVNTVTGYPEISYFISNFLLDNAVSCVSQANIDVFTGVKLYDTKGSPDKPPTTNYEYLFSLENASGGDPDPHSLFNV